LNAIFPPNIKDYTPIANPKSSHPSAEGVGKILIKPHSVEFDPPFIGGPITIIMTGQPYYNSQLDPLYDKIPCGAAG
jgi:hypothetical protein